MRLTSDDTAVAKCNEVSAHAAWTFVFRRDEGRWLIDGLTSGGGAQP
jgi:hypothetical protein